MTTPKTKQIIARQLNCESNEVLEVREWVYVYWVRVVGRRPTMVSKTKVSKVLCATQVEPGDRILYRDGDKVYQGKVEAIVSDQKAQIRFQGDRWIKTLEVKELLLDNVDSREKLGELILNSLDISDWLEQHTDCFGQFDLTYEPKSTYFVLIESLISQGYLRIVGRTGLEINF